MTFRNSFYLFQATTYLLLVMNDVVSATQPHPTPYPTHAPTTIHPVCDTHPSDEAVGVFAFYDPDCEHPHGGMNPNGILGCFYTGHPPKRICRHCKKFDTDQSKHLVHCPYTHPPTPAPTPHPTPYLRPPTPSPTPYPTPYYEPSHCMTSVGDQHNGVFAFYDPSCLHPQGSDELGILGCYAPPGYQQVCRHCQEFETNASKHLHDCPYIISSYGSRGSSSSNSGD